MKTNKQQMLKQANKQKTYLSGRLIEHTVNIGDENDILYLIKGT